MIEQQSNVERDRRALEIFVQACGLGGAERSALLEQLCSGDTDVRRRVDAMLAADSGDGDTPVGSDADVDGFVAKQIGQMAHADTGGLSAGPPSVDGEYTLLRVIGEGGMGTVYEAEQHHPRRRVAIKAIRPGRITPQMSKRFEYEAQVLARLEHPNIARLYESNTQSEGEDVRAYLAMELVDGVPIDTFCTQHTLGTRARLRLFMKVCDAVAYAHRMGVIHRDLKPANILVTRDGEPKILDFGVARTVERDGHAGITLITQHGQILGTLAYMSPEQVEGRVDVVDTRSDVYSLGVILYRLLVDRLPIDVSQDSLVEATRRIIHETPARLGLHHRRFKGDLEIVVGKALEKHPVRRYASVDQLRGEIDRHLSGRPIEARADSAFYVFRKAVWRHRGPVGIGTLLVTLLAAFGVYATLQANQSRRLAAAANTARLVATDRAEELRRQLYFSEIGFAQSALENNDMERAYNLLNSCEPELREWEWSYLQRLFDVSDDTFDLRIGRPRYASYSRDRSKVVVASLDREVVLMESGSDGKANEVRRMTVPAGAARAAVSQDGKWLAYGGAVDAIVLVDLAAGQQFELTIPGPPKTPESRTSAMRILQFTEDGRSLVAGGTNFNAYLWDVAGKTLRKTIGLEGALPICLQVSQNNSWAAIGDSKGAIRVIDTQTGETIRMLTGHDAPVWALALSHDGKRLASGDDDARTNIWDVDTGKRLTQEDTNDGWITALCFNPDDTRLAVGRADSIVRVLDLNDLSPTSTGVLRGHRRAIVHIDWQVDDTMHTVSLDGTLKTWNAESAKPVPTIVTSQRESIGLAFDAAGENIFVGGADGTVRSWSVRKTQSARPVEGRRLGDHKGPVLEIDVDPVNRRIVTAGKDGIVEIVSLDDPSRPPTVITPNTGGVPAVDFSPDGSLLVVGTEGEVSLWDPKSGKRVHDFEPKVVANELRFDRTGTTFFAACADGHVRKWDLKSRKCVADAALDSHGFYDVQISPDGATIAVGGDSQTVLLLDAITLKEIRRYVGHQGGVLAVAFHPGGKRLASGGTDGSLRIWDIDTAAELICLRGHRRRIQHISFSPDGATLASCNDDGTVKLWRTTQQSAEIR